MAILLWRLVLCAPGYVGAYLIWTNHAPVWAVGLGLMIFSGVAYLESRFNQRDNPK